jgi:hypothetical protein
MSDPFAPTKEDQEAAIEWLGPNRMDVGCGPNPLPGCVKYFDNRNWGNPNITWYDIYNGQLPRSNIYCRHVIEDLRFPEALLEQCIWMERGWIETPHISVEFTRGVDRNLPMRGFFHHYWFTTVFDDTLILIPKYSIVEYFEDIGPIRQWNNYYKWKDYQFKYKILEDPRDFEARDISYYHLLERGYNA